jgi:TPP-dependent indolepyruvate ferredoxin oxidoreductase alpha subunit
MVPRRRPAFARRPEIDPGCAGCPQLGLLRALRRAGIEARGALGCEPRRSPDSGPGRWAALVGAAEVLRGASSLLAGSAAAGARFLAVADRSSAVGLGAASRLEALLVASGARLRSFDPAALTEAEDAVAWAMSAGPGATLLALAPCVRRAPRSAPLAIAPVRCNRCGACLRLGCPAISDPGGEALAIDPGTCTGCGLCAPLCRSRAIEP